MKSMLAPRREANPRGWPHRRKTAKSNVGGFFRVRHAASRICSNLLPDDAPKLRFAGLPSEFGECSGRAATSPQAC